MAHIVPDDLTRLALAGARAPELATLALLRDTLPDDYTVFHGVHWTRQYQGRTLFGEIDFVVLNGAGRVLCIEQKNGPLEEREGQLYKRYGAMAKNVAAQVMRSLDSIREKFAHQMGAEAPLELDYLIYCPDHAVRRLAAAGIDAERVVDAGAREGLAARIRAILPAQAAGPGERVARIAAFFRQTFDLVADVHAHMGAQERNFARLSHGLLEVLANIEMAPLRLQVLATAGNGKTLVARHFFDRSLAQGRRPLLLCFNRPLAERLKRLVAAGGLVETWYGFCDRFLRSRGIVLAFEAMRGDPQFWARAAEQVEELALAGPLPEEWRFDTLIVDEAQDFEGDWFEAVRLFLAPEADILWLEDPNQNLRGTDPVKLRALGFVGYRSLLNYRSPASIADFLARALPELPCTGANDLPGLGVGVTPYTDPDEQPRLVGRIVGQLLARRFRPQDVAILSCRGLERTVFRDLPRVGNHTLARFTGAYDLFGNQIHSAGQILFDTVRRFKGQQSAAVVLVDIDPDARRLAQELRVLFCGMTRATVRLELVCRGDNPVVAERILSAR